MPENRTFGVLSLDDAVLVGAFGRRDGRFVSMAGGEGDNRNGEFDNNY